MIALMGSALALLNAQTVECELQFIPDGSRYGVAVICDANGEVAPELITRLNDIARGVGPISQPIHEAYRDFEVEFDELGDAISAPVVRVQFVPASFPRSAARRMSSASCGFAGVMTEDGRLAETRAQCNSARDQVARDYEDAIIERSVHWRFLPISPGACVFMPIDYKLSDPLPESVLRSDMCES